MQAQAQPRKAAEESRISDAIYSRHREIERSSKSYMRSLVPQDRPLTVLDVGCGTGLNAEIIRGKGHTVVGVDVSPVAIAQFVANGFEGHVCDVTDGLPFPDGRFDLVYASEVIEHVNDTAAFLGELARVIKPGGRLLLSTPNSAFWVFRLAGLLGWTLSEVQHSGHVRFFSKRSLVKAIGNAGFVDVQAGARHIYMALPDSIGRLLAPLLTRIGAEREYRLKTDTYVWHFNRFARRASPLWADTFIVTAGRP
ncbi:MAG: hypothetical protein DPW22_07520 [Alphaproteobacteria bacterium]|nr:hypothetical protein [Alphaproteobacteria bacterium]